MRCVGDFAGDGKIQLPGGRKISRSGSPGLGKSLRAGQSSSGVGVGDAFQFSLGDFACAVHVFRAAAERVHFEGCVAEPLQTRTAILPGSKWSCLLLRFVSQDAQSEVTLIFPPLKLRVFVGDIMTFMNGRNKELVEMAEELLKKLTIEVRRRAWSYRLLKEGMKERARRSLPARRWRSSRNAAEKKELPWK